MNLRCDPAASERLFHRWPSLVSSLHHWIALSLSDWAIPPVLTFRLSVNILKHCCQKHLQSTLRGRLTWT